MIPEDSKKWRKEIACYMRRLYNRGLTTASGGNISMRFRDGILITPSAIDKGTVKGKQIGIMSLDGRNLTPDLKPSIESAMHLAIYEVRADVNAVVHAHPPLATAFTAMKKEINCCLIAEARAVLGVPVMSPYALMGTKDLAKTVSNAASGKGRPNVILLQNHGIVCLGKDILTAFDRLEVIEAAAKMTILTTLMQSANELTTEQLVAIDAMLSA